MACVAGVFGKRMYGEVAEVAYDSMNGGGERDLLFYDEGEEERELVGDGEIVGDINGEEDDSLGDGNKFLSWMMQRAFRLLLVAYYPSSGEHYAHGTNRDLQENEDVTGTNDMRDMMVLLFVAAAVALVISTLALSFMISHAQVLIKFALLFNIAATAVVSDQVFALSTFCSNQGILFSHT